MTSAGPRGGATWALVMLLPWLVGACTSSSHASTPPTSKQPGFPVPSSTLNQPARAVTAPPAKPAVAGLTQRLEVSLPAKVQETAAAATSDRLFVIAGYDSNGRNTANVFEFDGSSWSEGPSLPVALNHPAAAAINGAIFVAGGFAAPGATARAFELDDPHGLWREIAPMHHARAASVLMALGGQLYAIGGRVGSTQVAIAERYDPGSREWTDLAPLPHARNHLSGYVEDGRICVTGGREPATSARTDCLDPVNDIWSVAPSLPVATSGAAAGVAAGVLTVAGGESANETSLVPTVAERGDGVWSLVAMLAPRHGTAYALFHDRLWMCGGATAPGVRASSTCTSIGGGQS